MQDTIIGRFSKYLTEIKYPKQEASWNIAGIIRGHNGFYKFDVRDMFKLSDGTSAQKGRTDSMADKMVLEMKYQWVILDLEELNKYIKDNKLNKVYLNDILSRLEWTIFIPKNE